MSQGESNIVLFLQLVATFIGFGFTVGVGILLSLIIDLGDASATRVAARAARSLAMIGAVSLAAAIALGFGVAWSMGYTLTSPWLLIAALSAAVIVAMAFAVLRPWGLRLATAAESESQNLGVLSVAARDPARRAGPLVGLLWLIAIAAVVFKP